MNRQFISFKKRKKFTLSDNLEASTDLTRVFHGRRPVARRGCTMQPRENAKAAAAGNKSLHYFLLSYGFFPAAKTQGV